MGTHRSNEGSQVCERAVALARQGEALHWDLSELLTKIQDDELWRVVGARSFKQFLQEHARIAESTARQLIKVRRMCETHNIPREKMEESGWSKLAEVAKNITPENKDQLLTDVAELSLAELRAKHRDPASDGKKPPKKEKETIIWTEEIEEAIRHASRFTRSIDRQTNLEYIAQQFKVLAPVSPEYGRQLSLN